MPKEQKRKRYKAPKAVTWAALPAPGKYTYTPTLFTMYVTSVWPDTSFGQYSPADWEFGLRENAPRGTDLIAEAKRARAWELSANSGKIDHRRFFYNWMDRAKSPARVTTTNAESTSQMLDRMRKGEWKEF